MPRSPACEPASRVRLPPQQILEDFHSRKSPFVVDTYEVILRFQYSPASFISVFFLRILLRLIGDNLVPNKSRFRGSGGRHDGQQRTKVKVLLERQSQRQMRRDVVKVPATFTFFL